MSEATFDVPHPGRHAHDARVATLSRRAVIRLAGIHNAASRPRCCDPTLGVGRYCVVNEADDSTRIGQEAAVWDVVALTA